MTTFYVLEAHIDDSFLSMHRHMTDWIKQGHTVIIGSVYTGGRKRDTEIKAYAELIGASTHCYFHDPELDPDLGEFTLPSSFMLGREALTIVCPIAIQNHQHVKLREWVEKSVKPDLYYLDIPYYTKAKNEDEVNEKLKGFKIVSVKKPTHMKGKDKYWKCFKGQSKYFFYNPPESWVQIPEILLEKE
jgi:hypothetical protein